MTKLSQIKRVSRPPGTDHWRRCGSLRDDEVLLRGGDLLLPDRDRPSRRRSRRCLSRVREPRDDEDEDDEREREPFPFLSSRFSWRVSREREAFRERDRDREALAIITITRKIRVRVWWLGAFAGIKLYGKKKIKSKQR